MTGTANRNQFVGTWKLRSMVAHLDGNETREPYGHDPLGYITYTDTGFMHAILMNPERPPVGTAPEDFGRKEGARRLAMALGQLPALARTTTAAMQSSAYSAQWEIRGGEVVHHVTASVFPDWIGTDLIRTYEFAGEELTLTAKYPNDEAITLVWQKIG